MPNDVDTQMLHVWNIYLHLPLVQIQCFYLHLPTWLIGQYVQIQAASLGGPWWILKILRDLNFLS